jgi:hypothetical protein
MNNFLHIRQKFKRSYFAINETAVCMMQRLGLPSSFREKKTGIKGTFTRFPYRKRSGVLDDKEGQKS